MGKKLTTAGQVKPGDTILVEGVPSKVVSVSKSKPGKHGSSKARIVAVGILDEKKRDIVLPGHEKVEVPMIEKKNAQVLSVSGDMANVMDTESYETFDIKIPEELKGQVTAGAQVLYWQIMGDKLLKQVKGG